MHNYAHLLGALVVVLIFGWFVAALISSETIPLALSPPVYVLALEDNPGYVYEPGPTRELHVSKLVHCKSRQKFEVMNRSNRNAVVRHLDTGLAVRMLGNNNYSLVQYNPNDPVTVDLVHLENAGVVLRSTTRSC